MKINQYSIAICLVGEAYRFISEMKSELRNVIGDYDSCKSSGHITFNSFAGCFTEIELERIKKKLERFCDNKSPIQLRFTDLSSYDNSFTNKRTLFLAPDELTKILLKDLMKVFGRDIQIRQAIKILDPHLTIARNLSQEDFEKAMILFENRIINLEFLCGSLSLRKLEDSKGQFNVIEEFSFNNNLNTVNIQTALW